MAEYILVINPGSTSTKVAVFDGEKEVHSMNIDHPAEELKSLWISMSSCLSEKLP